METYTGFKLTPRQKEAVRLMASDCKNIMFYGGARSGKTFNTIRAITIRASKEKSRHIALRQTFNSIKTSIVLDTFPKVMNLCFPNLSYQYNKTDNYALLPNGSEIWFAGLDDEKRVEKILGKEYSTLFFNECSQIPYTSVQVALSRLAEKNNLKKKVYFDCNPPSKSHWTYSVFQLGLNPIDSEPLKDKEDYASILMNPQDNLENIDKDYIKLLESMSERDRDRFLLGLYSDDSDGQVYYSFDFEKHVQQTTWANGSTYVFMDFNVSPMTATIAQMQNSNIVVHDEIWLEVGDTFKIVDELHKKGIKGAIVIPDSTGKNRKTSGKSDFDILRESGFVIPQVHNPAVWDRVNNMNRLFQSNQIIINPKCKKLIYDLQKVVWKNNALDQSGSNKMLTHISDGLGYGANYLLPLGIRHKITQQGR